MDKFIYHPLTVIVCIALAAGLLGTPDLAFIVGILGLVFWLVVNAIKHWRGGQ